MVDPRNKPTWRVETFPAPAAGAEFSITPNMAAHWLIRSFSVSLTASAVAGDREISLAADNGTSVWWRAIVEDIQVANTTRSYSAFGGAVGSFATADVVTLGFPTDGLFLPQGHRLRSITATLDAGDQFSALTAFIIEFPTGPFTHFWPIPPLMEEESS